MSHLRRTDEDRFEDEMADFAYVEKDAPKTYAFRYRGRADEIPMFFKRGLRIEGDDVYLRSEGRLIALRRDDVIIVKGLDTSIMDRDVFDSQYVHIDEYVKYV